MEFGGVNFSVQQAIPQAEQQRLDANIQALRSTLDAAQKRLLLQIIDDNDLICASHGEDMFAQGFRAAMRLTLACLQTP